MANFYPKAALGQEKDRKGPLDVAVVNFYRDYPSVERELSVRLSQDSSKSLYAPDVALLSASTRAVDLWISLVSTFTLLRIITTDSVRRSLFIIDYWSLIF